MLKKLRLRITLLYLILAIVLALVVGGGTYSLVNYYFRATNDYALKVKMGLQFASLDIPLPLDLYEAVRQAGLVITKVTPTPSFTQSQTEESSDKNRAPGGEGHEEGLQESELADIYVLPLTLEGGLVSGLNTQLTIADVNSEAVAAAVQNGYDFRTVKTNDGASVRLFTYLVPDDEQVQVFQVGRYLSAQQQVLKQLLDTMVLLGGLITILFGVASWVLAGRTIKPSQQAWDKQQAFIANASHELRTPLTLIHAGLELSMRKVASEEQRELLSDVLSDANYMNKLIEDLLLLSRLDAHSLKMDIQPVKISDFIPEILRQVERLTEAQQISLVQNIEDINILADPVRLKQILLIILDNAIRNNQAGGSVKIEIALKNEKGVILVNDTGPGIADENIDRVFDRFYKIN
ncbi:MAG: hypothetical protein C0401_03310, partial [Anaerolinea sp.]|nr:hypothetical protein [Anaerolinea sp.]